MKNKKPVYAALDLHSRYSVLGSMEHGGKTGERMRFPTEAEGLRAEVTRLRQRKRPLHLTMDGHRAHTGDLSGAGLRATQLARCSALHAVRFRRVRSGVRFETAVW